MNFSFSFFSLLENLSSYLDRSKNNKPPDSAATATDADDAADVVELELKPKKRLKTQKINLFLFP